MLAVLKTGSSTVRSDCAISRSTVSARTAGAQASPRTTATLANQNIVSPRRRRDMTHLPGSSVGSDGACQARGIASATLGTARDPVKPGAEPLERNAAARVPRSLGLASAGGEDRLRVAHQHLLDLVVADAGLPERGENVV